jgi:hypothetical protein
MTIMPKFKPGQLVEFTMANERYVGLVKKTSLSPRRGMDPMVLVGWCGSPPRDYEEEYVEQSILKLVEEV